MTSLKTVRSKCRIEIVPIEADFSESLLSGEVLIAAESSVFVFAGVDLEPTHIILGAPTNSDSSVLQRIQLGVPGVIYTVVLTGITNQDRRLRISFKQAILIDAKPPGPIYQYSVFSSKLYPVRFADHIRVSIQPVYGALSGQAITYDFVDAISVQALPTGGALRVPLVYYEFTDSIFCSPVPVSGSLRDIFKSYEFSDSVTVSVIPTGGMLDRVLLSTTLSDSITVSALPTGGTLS